VGGAGDVNGDGYADMLIAERNFADEGRPERGRVFIFHGGKNGPSSEPDCTVLGPAAYAQFGFHAVGMGDIDGDGFDDVAISAPYYSDGNTKNLGMIEIYRGGPHGCDRTTVWRVIGDRQDAYLGRLLTAGDLNGDHISDLVALASFWGDAIPHRGLLVAYLGQRPKP
jgi:hypothetical protein